MVGYQRFLTNRSGETIFVACNRDGDAIQAVLDEQLIANEVFKSYDYHVSKRNCYFHSWYCITGEVKQFASFEQFNTALKQKFGHSIFWDKAII